MIPPCGEVYTVNFVLSLVTLLTLNKARNGAVIAISQLITLEKGILVVLLCSALISGSIATFLALKIAKIFSRVIGKVNYKGLVISVISFIALLVFYFSGFLGIFVLMVATAVGLIAPLVNVSRSHAMGCLILPVILFFVL